MKMFFVRSRCSRLLLSLPFAFVGPVERCGLENFGSPWCAIDVGFQTFREKKTDKTFDDAEWMLTETRVAPECRDTAEPTRLCCGTLTDEHTYWATKEYMRTGY
jgi:hypothetical protein